MTVHIARLTSTVQLGGQPLTEQQLEVVAQLVAAKLKAPAAHSDASDDSALFLSPLPPLKVG